MLIVSVLDLQKYLDQGVRVKLQGGREVHGVLKGFDPLVNVVLDECIEFIRGIFIMLGSLAFDFYSCIFSAGSNAGGSFRLFFSWFFLCAMWKPHLDVENRASYT